MKLLTFAAVLAATVHASVFVNHMSDKYQVSGSGALSFGAPSKNHAPLEQFYNYTNTTGTLFNETDDIIPDFGITEDQLNVTWTWQFTAGYAGKYFSAPDKKNYNLQNFTYIVNLVSQA